MFPQYIVYIYIKDCWCLYFCKLSSLLSVNGQFWVFLLLFCPINISEEPLLGDTPAWTLDI